jgi:DNA mismatch repair protein MutS
MPGAVVRQARSTLESLEQREAAARLQVDLFSQATDQQAPQGAAASAVMGLLEQLQPDALSPREALQALYRLKDAAQGQGDTPT